MNILNKIIKYKKNEINILKSNYTIKYLQSTKLFEKLTVSLKNNLKSSKSGIIAEHKIKSPSKNIINDYLSIEDVINGYKNAKVSGISVLTDSHFFAGSKQDLKISKEIFSGPVLRKDFLIDEFQIIESKSLGADVVLLIASVLSKKEINNFSKLAKELNLEVLVEIHSEGELDKALCQYVDMIGVNNRDLKTFKIDINISKNISKKIPSDFTKISESGLHSYESIIDLRLHGFEGFLIGEYFMKSADPGMAAKSLIKKIEQ